MAYLNGENRIVFICGRRLFLWVSGCRPNSRLRCRAGRQSHPKTAGGGKATTPTPRSATEKPLCAAQAIAVLPFILQQTLKKQLQNRKGQISEQTNSRGNSPIGNRKRLGDQPLRLFIGEVNGNRVAEEKKPRPDHRNEEFDFVSHRFSSVPSKPTRSGSNPQVLMAQLSRVVSQQEEPLPQVVVNWTPS